MADERAKGPGTEGGADDEREQAGEPQSRSSDKQERPEDRPEVGSVRPDDYPQGQRAGGE